MALIFAESFDCGYGLRPWTQTQASFLVPTVAGRTGTNGRRLDGSGAGANGFLRRAFGVGETDDTFIVGFALKVPAALTSGSEVFFQFKADNNVTTHVQLLYTANNEIAASGPGGTYGVTEVNTFAPGQWIYVECKVILSDAAGEVTMRINGVERFSATGVDTKNGGTDTEFDNVVWISFNNDHDIDDVYVCNGLGGVNDDFLGDVSIYCLSPDDNGNYSELDGSDGNQVDNYLLVDEIALDTADFVSSAVTGLKDTYEYADLVPTDGVVKAVVLNHFAEKDSSDPAGFAPVVRHASTDDIGATVALSETFTVYRTYYDEDPVTTSEWLISDVNNDEFGFQVETP